MRLADVRGRSSHLIPRATESQGEVLSRRECEEICIKKKLLCLVYREWTASARLGRRILQFSRHEVTVTGWQWRRWREVAGLSHVLAVGGL